MAAYAEDAVEYVKKNFETDLDFSEQSVQLIEALLGALHDQMPAELRAAPSGDGPPPQIIDQFAKIFGGYIGEVMRRNWGARWTDRSDA